MKNRTEKPDSGWTLLEHTADIRIEIRGRSLSELFEIAAYALVHILIPKTAVLPRNEEIISLQEDTTEELLVSWLREILFRYQTSGLVPHRLDILEATLHRLTCKVAFGVPGEQIEPDMEIKGVTYHGLNVQAHDWGYSARVVFDI